MACYISSNNNRFYVALESSYGEVAAVANARRFAGIQLRARQQAVQLDRRDKTGSRTFLGLPAGVKRQTSYQLRTYLAGWSDQGIEPSQGPLIRASLGAPVRLAGTHTLASASGTTLNFTAAHGLAVGEAVTFGSEIRFVAAIPNAQSVVLNVPFTLAATAGSVLGPTASYAPANSLASFNLFDYWSPETAVHRILAGTAVDRMAVKINADFHEFEFRGPARDLIDSVSFAPGDGALASFPDEPNIADFESNIVPGHLGQAWLGANPERFYTITEAEFTLDNNIDVRDREFGSTLPRCLSAGLRDVRLNFTLHEQDDAATKSLYQAARQRSPISVMLQLGQQAEQMFGIYLRSIVPEVPEFDDGETRLQWRFTGSRAQGSANDEVFLAFA
ncbi:MAG: hypothetical protein K2X03_20600 [Bryobacteraceae bacterium]|nr:hypothetical protein [Bryobacteraceae bacterium]